MICFLDFCHDGESVSSHGSCMCGPMDRVIVVQLFVLSKRWTGARGEEENQV